MSKNSFTFDEYLEFDDKVVEEVIEGFSKESTEDFLKDLKNFNGDHIPEWSLTRFCIEQAILEVTKELEMRSQIEDIVKNCVEECLAVSDSAKYFNIDDLVDHAVNQLMEVMWVVDEVES